MASLLHSAPLINKKKEQISVDSLKGKIIAFYFSAHWCPPCRMFSPELASVYEEAKQKGITNFEIVFVTSDRDEQAMLEYMNEVPMDWLALPFADPRISELKQKYEIRGIPSLVFVDADGNLITKDGRMKVMEEGVEAIANICK